MEKASLSVLVLAAEPPVCMLSHECEFVPAWLLDRACLVMLGSSSQGCFPRRQRPREHRLDFSRERGGGHGGLCSLVML